MTQMVQFFTKADIMCKLPTSTVMILCLQAPFNPSVLNAMFIWTCQNKHLLQQSALVGSFRKEAHIKYTCIVADGPISMLQTRSAHPRYQSAGVLHKAGTGTMRKYAIFGLKFRMLQTKQLSSSSILQRCLH